MRTYRDPSPCKRHGIKSCLACDIKVVESPYAALQACLSGRWVPTDNEMMTLLPLVFADWTRDRANSTAVLSDDIEVVLEVKVGGEWAVTHRFRGDMPGQMEVPAQATESRLRSVSLDTQFEVRQIIHTSYVDVTEQLRRTQGWDLLDVTSEVSNRDSDS